MSGASYFTPEGLQDLQGYESSGNPAAQSQKSTASGLYGFLNSTWQEYAPQAGVDIGQYPTAASAPTDVQTSVAQITPASNWLCPGCDAGITNEVANNPSLLSPTPVSDTAPLSFSSPDLLSGTDDAPDIGLDTTDASFGNPLYLPGTGDVASYGSEDPLGLAAAAQNSLANDPVSGAIGTGVAAGSTVAASSSNWFQALLDNVENFAERGGAFLVALVIGGIAIYALTRGEGVGKTTVNLVGAGKRGLSHVAAAAAG